MPSYRCAVFAPAPHSNDAEGSRSFLAIAMGLLPPGACSTLHAWSQRMSHLIAGAVHLGRTMARCLWIIVRNIWPKAGKAAIMAARATARNDQAFAGSVIAKGTNHAIRWQQLCFVQFGHAVAGGRPAKAGTGMVPAGD